MSDKLFVWEMNIPYSFIKFNSEKVSRMTLFFNDDRKLLCNLQLKRMILFFKILTTDKCYFYFIKTSTDLLVNFLSYLSNVRVCACACVSSFFFQFIFHSIYGKNSDYTHFFAIVIMVFTYWDIKEIHLKNIYCGTLIKY